MTSSHSVFYDEGKTQLNLWWQATLVLTVFLGINLVLVIFDQRVLSDELIWIKPLKFEISIIIHFVTLATLAALLTVSKRQHFLWKGMTYLVVTAGLFEAMYIFLQAARGRESHYNISTAIEAVMYGLMGLGALALVLGSFYLGLMIFKDYRSNRNSTLLLSSALGLTIGSVLTLIIAGYLSQQPTGFLPDPNLQDDVLRMPLFSWYLNGQDLRIPHFLATHMMQLLPMYGFWLSRRDLCVEACKMRVYWVTGIYSFIVIALFMVAIS